MSLFRRLSVISGLSILAVVCSHSSAWGITALFWWVDRYRPVSSPNFDEYGSLTYWALILLRQLPVFAVPGFLFVSGFFSGYAGRGSSNFTWKMVLQRITTLLFPYLFWSVVIFIKDAILIQPEPWFNYALKLLTGNAHITYFYVLVIMQCYLLAPWIIRIAKKYPVQLIVISAILLFLSLLVQYAGLMGIIQPKLPGWFLPNFLFYFCLGVVASLYQPFFVSWLIKWKRRLIGLSIVFAIMNIVECEWFFRTTGIVMGSITLFSANLYAISVLLALLSIQTTNPAQLKVWDFLGRHSYAIYLIHYILLEMVARLIYHFLPQLLGFQILFQPIMISLAIMLPIIAMAALKKTPLRIGYRYIFG